MHDDRNAVSPWAFFLPIALAVLVGSLVADAIGGLLRDRFDDTPVAVVEAVTAPVETSTDDTAPPVLPAPAAYAPLPQAAPVVDEAPVSDAAELAAPAAAEAPPATTNTTAATDGARRLSGPMTARQAGESESCINNTVATRNPNGWEQALENDAPVRCEATSN